MRGLKGHAIGGKSRRLNGHWQSGGKEEIIIDYRHWIRGIDGTGVYDWRNFGWGSPGFVAGNNFYIPYQWVRTKVLNLDSTYTTLEPKWEFVKLHIYIKNTYDFNTTFYCYNSYKPMDSISGFSSSDYYYAMSPASHQVTSSDVDPSGTPSDPDHVKTASIYNTRDPVNLNWGNTNVYGTEMILDKDTPFGGKWIGSYNEIYWEIGTDFYAYAHSDVVRTGTSTYIPLQYVIPRLLLVERQNIQNVTTPGFAEGYPLRVVITPSTETEVKNNGLWRWVT